MLTKSFRDTVLEKLKDPEFATFFLNDAFETGTAEEINEAVATVLKANGEVVSREVLPMEKVITVLRTYGITLVTRLAA